MSFSFSVASKDGAIFRSGTYSDAGAESHVRKTLGGGDILIVGESYPTDGIYFYNTHTSQVERVPPKPAEHHAFNYKTRQWVADTPAAWDSVKQQRSRLLADSDWVVTKATEAGLPVTPEWTAYRQALRDITVQADPWAIAWPVSP